MDRKLVSREHKTKIVEKKPNWANRSVCTNWKSNWIPKENQPNAVLIQWYATDTSNQRQCFKVKHIQGKNNIYQCRVEQSPAQPNWSRYIRIQLQERKTIFNIVVFCCLLWSYGMKYKFRYWNARERVYLTTYTASVKIVRFVLFRFISFRYFVLTLEFRIM